TRRHEGEASSACASGSAGTGTSTMPRSGTVTPGDCIACQAGSHQSSGRQVSTGIGPVGPLYPICSPSPPAFLGQQATPVMPVHKGMKYYVPSTMTARTGPARHDPNVLGFRPSVILSRPSG